MDMPTPTEAHKKLEKLAGSWRDEILLGGFNREVDFRLRLPFDGVGDCERADGE